MRIISVYNYRIYRFFKSMTDSNQNKYIYLYKRGSLSHKWVFIQFSVSHNNLLFYENLTLFPYIWLYTVKQFKSFITKVFGYTYWYVIIHSRFGKLIYLMDGWEFIIKLTSHTPTTINLWLKSNQNRK